MKVESIKLFNFQVNNLLDINTKEKDVYNNKFKILIQIRNPGIDLVRILAMFGIIISHLLIHGQVIKKYSMHDKLNLLNCFFLWHINGFGLISGMVGYKKHKYSNLFYLWVNVIFYSVGITLFYNLKSVNISKLYYDFFPVIFNKYWYFTTYFGMYLFLPIINKGIEYLTKSELKILLLSIFIIYIIWHDFNNSHVDIFKINGGASVLWFLILYIVGGYIGKNKVDTKGIKNIIFCLVCLIFFLSSSLLCYYLPRYNLSKIKVFFFKKIIIILKNFFILRYDSLPKILQAISISLFLINIKYNKYLAKIISFFGSLIRNIFNKYPNYLPLFSIIKIIIIKALKIFGICVIIDYIRYLIFKFLKIKKSCIIIEKIILKILN